MKKLDALKQITSKPSLALLLGVKAQSLTHVLYILKPATQYTSFTIPKRSGGTRTIYAPSDKLKSLQSKLSNLLQDCIKEINETKYPDIKPNKTPTLAHGFVKKRSILTNAMMHLKQKNVLNIDLSDYFGSFNFGRVRGFFIKNRNFKLHPDIATVIAQIACLDDKLPQGSPCSPVITNLITHSLDIRLASLAKKYSCTYSRYADDITISTRKSAFPNQIMMQEENGEYLAGKKLTHEITRAGFSINEKKTRIQYKDSRQDVTGLIVNKKINVKQEYWRTVRSQCNSLFQTGSFFKKVYVDGVEVEIEGNINELEGQLNFIDQIDRFNRLRPKPPINRTYALANHKLNTFQLLNSREKTFSRFLYFRCFYGNAQPTILCEGKTDNIYLKSAINMLATDFPKLAKAKTKEEEYKLLILFIRYSARTRFLMGLDDSGGFGNLIGFINKFDEHYKFYKANNPQHPVIIVLDNDKGFNSFPSILKKISTSLHPATLKKDDYRKANFIHVMHNLYIVLTPLDPTEEGTDIEYFFDDATRLKEHDGRCFNTVLERDYKTDLGKDSFATHIIKGLKNSINFNGLKPLLERITAAIAHYDSIK